MNREYYEIFDVQKYMEKKERIQSAKTDKDMKRFHILKKSEDLSNLYSDQITLKIRQKEERQSQSQKRLNDEKQ